MINREANRREQACKDIRKSRTEHGIVEGRLRRGNADFRGISYAPAPGRCAAFRGSRACRLVEGVRPAVEFGPPPPQSGPGPKADRPQTRTG